MDYYLYSHSNADGIFYIGKGCGDRFKQKYLASRSAEWHKVAKHGYLTKIEATGTEECIFSAEKMYIKLLIEQGVNLVNKFHNPNWRKIHSDEAKKKMSRLGMKHSAETKQKVSYHSKKQWQHIKLEKANNYRRSL